MSDVSPAVAAQKLGLAYDTILRKIRAGELRAMNHNPSEDGRPTYTITELELARYRLTAARRVSRSASAGNESQGSVSP